MVSGRSKVIENDGGRCSFAKNGICSNTSSCHLLYLRDP